ncbi:hypothetical protein ACVWWG_002247 [Bradyrhizobium sp. LB7.2]
MRNTKTLGKQKRFARAAQDLIAVTFSLWRAAFLADKTGRRADVFDHGRLFLERVIEDNAISYPIDKTSREWTFNYYTRNARSSLQEIAKFWTEAPEYEGRKRDSQERWDYCQMLLDKHIDVFDELLTKKATNSAKAAAAKQTRIDRKKRRKQVREITIASRNGAGQ